MSKENSPKSPKEVSEQKLATLRSLLNLYESQLASHEASITSFNQANPGFIGFGIADSVDLHESIRRIKKEIAEIEANLKK